MNRLVVKPLIWIAALAACLALCCLPSMAEEAAGTRVFVDGLGREVEIPAEVERIVCTGVGALRYVCYMGAQDRVVGVEQYETCLLYTSPLYTCLYCSALTVKPF